jgi:hypothetical protein
MCLLLPGALSFLLAAEFFLHTCPHARHWPIEVSKASGFVIINSQQVLCSFGSFMLIYAHLCSFMGHTRELGHLVILHKLAELS